MAPRSMRRGFGVRAILAGGLIAILGTIVPASAIDAPAFVNSSFDSGWNPSATAVAARFDKNLKAMPACFDNPTDKNLVAGCEWTSAKVFKFGTGEVITAAARDDSRGIDANGAIVTGSSIVWVAASSLATDGTEYYMEVSALGAALSSPTTAVTWRSEPFTVDAAAPHKPVVQSPTALVTRELKAGDTTTPVNVHTHVSIADPAQAPVVEFMGTAADVTGVDGDLTATSGLAAVELQFFDVAGRPVHKQRFAVESVGAAESDWLVGADEIVDRNGGAALSPGIFTLKVVGFDIAGGASAPSIPVQFIFAGGGTGGTE